MNGSSSYNGESSNGISADGIIGRDVTEPWLCAACAGLTGRI